MTGVDEKLKQGIAALKEGREKEARDMLFEVLEQDEGNEQAWLWMSGAVESDKQREICLEKVLEINPDNEYALRGLERLRIPEDKEQPGAQRGSPDDQTVRVESEILREASACLRGGNKEEARRILRSVVGSDPRNETAWLLLSRTFDNLDLERNCLRRVLELNPTSKEAREQLQLMTSVEAVGTREIGAVDAKEDTREASRERNRRLAERSSGKGLSTGAWVALSLALLLCIVPCAGLVVLTGIPESTEGDNIGMTQARAARLCCEGCAEENVLIKLWEHPADNPEGSFLSNRGEVVGRVPHNTLVTIKRRVWIEGEERYYFYAEAENVEGWIPESFVEWGTGACSQESLEPYLTREPTPGRDEGTGQ